MVPSTAPVVVAVALMAASYTVWWANPDRHSRTRPAAQSLYKMSELMGNSPEICRPHYAALIPDQMRNTVEFDGREPTPALRLA